MKRKIIIVAAVMWFISAIGGGVWGKLENYIRRKAIPPGQLEVGNLKALYGAHLFDEVVGECDRAELDPRYTNYEPQIRYVRWVADRRLNRIADAEKDQALFLARFPDNELAADIHFSMAMDLLASTNYDGAAGELKLVAERFPKSSVATKARDIINRLVKAKAATAPSH